jgi:hypothetical protein
MTKKILELSLSFFLVACGVSLLIGLYSLKPIIDSGQLVLNEGKALITDSRNRLQESRETEAELLKSATDMKDTIYEIGIASAVIALEEQRIISPTDADRMILQSIDEIGKRSDRLGQLAKYINDARIRNSRR